MPAYAIAEIVVTDPDAYEDYTAHVGETLAAFGGRYVVRGGLASLLEDTLTHGGEPGRIVVIEFPDMARLRAWHASDAYAEPRRIRRGAALGRLLAVEGVDGG